MSPPPCAVGDPSLLPPLSWRPQPPGMGREGAAGAVWGPGCSRVPQGRGLSIGSEGGAWPRAKGRDPRAVGAA